MIRIGKRAEWELTFREPDIQTATISGAQILIGTRPRPRNELDLCEMRFDVLHMIGLQFNPMRTLFVLLVHPYIALYVFSRCCIAQQPTRNKNHRTCLQSCTVATGSQRARPTIRDPAVADTKPQSR